MERIEIYDTTLRDGTQGAGVEFSAEDKLRCARALDQLGVDFIEGGWPGSNPRDMEFFRLAREIPWRSARLVAFGSTRRAGLEAHADPNLRALLEAGTEWVTVFGKSWDLHVRKALRTTLEENLRMIEDSVRYLRAQGRRVIYDAEHFFDGFYANPEYALATVRVAAEAGADRIVLCDTNGGRLPHEIGPVVRTVRERLSVPLGIHTHNDTGCAVANTVEAVRAGCVHVQGTINGYGERCGNADLCVVIPNLVLKLGYACLQPDALVQLVHISHLVAELANLPPDEYQPYVGRNAFAHKGGVHGSAVRADPTTYEHVAPEQVGNRRRFVVSDLSGRANIVSKAEELGLQLDPHSPTTARILEQVKWLEYTGYQFEGAEASFELLARRLLGEPVDGFEAGPFLVVVHRTDGQARAEATVRVRVDGVEEHTAAEGNGPVHALDRALRKALERFYPEIRRIRLVDYKVRVLNAEAATAARVRVLIQSTDGVEQWGTVGVSENVVEASWIALVDSLNYALWRNRTRIPSVPQTSDA
ncbi:MAG: citramalate synthase [Armatimonadota bacterium]|nr:citramalate synthase [Armatimonadota bacterium]MDR7571282.1 citramalate synthase [Armatimonadota bacterium]MDR7614313.1 citramalate synthase [Armatimonadota bacterium]